MLLSSFVVWRYRSLDDFRRECPRGEKPLQRVVVERLDEGLAWLESLGAPVVARSTGNPRTVGVRFEPSGLTNVLARAAGDVRLGVSLFEAEGPVVLATGGFQGDRSLVADWITPEAERLWLRANRWSSGDGLRYGLERGAALTAGLDEFYGRNMPAPPARVSEERFVELAQLYGRLALVLNELGEEFFPRKPSWSELDLVQATARQPGARAWYIVDERALREVVRDRTVAGMITACERAGGEVRRAGTREGLAAALALPTLPETDKLIEPPFTAVRVAPGITHTIGGLAIDEHARVLNGNAAPIGGLYACGADVGGISTGGYASGLAAALVFGLIAAEHARL
jgi:succinate dehydrogenase/fumarate reductase flavoprotein subunit